MITNKQTIYAITLLALLLVVAFFIYLPGVQGAFIFDDIPNLSPIGKYTELSSWSNFWLYLLEGDSGPTGRPISLASFYLNDNAWPSSPEGFIYTNILIHLLNGLLVYWFVLKLAKTLHLSSLQQTVVAILSTSLWLLHPMNTTTVLYIVQRMTELSAIFMLSALIFYLTGREALFQHPKKGFLLLFLGVGSSLILAILSKENGILLVTYILVIEYFLLRPLQKTPPTYFNYWLHSSVSLPFLFVVLYLFDRAWSGGGFEIRNFTLYERLLTETRILFDYLHHILLPSIGSSSLFHDDYIISHSLFDPISTVFSLVGIFILFFISITVRKKYPLVSFAILWFFSGHLLESTVLSLELYFEHRNYLPMLGFLISISIWLAINIEKYKKSIVLISILVLSLFSFLTYQNTVLWGKPFEMIVNWHNEHPNSIRTQEAYHFFIKNNKQKVTKLSAKTTPYSVIWNLNQACMKQTITNKMLLSANNVIKEKAIHPVTANALRDLMSHWLGGACHNIKSKDMESFLITMMEITNKKKSNHYAHHLHYWLSELYRAKGDLNNTMIHLERAYSLRPDSQLLLIQASTLYSAGLKKDALKRLNDTRLLKTSIRKRIILSLVKPQINKLKTIIKNNSK